MRLDEYYTVRELLQLDEEKAQKNEFLPVFGNGAKRNSSDNEKAVNDIIKNAMAYDEKGRTKDSKRGEQPKNPDYNRTNLDWDYTTCADNSEDVPKSYKDRVKQLATVGTESDMADYYDTKGNEEFYKNRKECTKVSMKNKEADAISGVKGKTYHKLKYDMKPKSALDEQNAYTSKSITPRVNKANNRCQFTTPDVIDDNDGDIKMDAGLEHSHEGRHTSTAVQENRITKRLKFKNTVFLDESQVLAKVPEDYKIDENRFYMQDKTGTDYLVECKADPFGYIHMSIENKLNKKEINEELDNMRRLAGYKYSDDNVKVDKTKLQDMSESISNFRQLLK